VYIAGETWEISRGSSITTDNKEVADAFERLPYVDVETIEQQKKKASSKRKKNVTTRKKNKKIKRRKKKGKTK